VSQGSATTIEGRHQGLDRCPGLALRGTLVSRGWARTSWRPADQPIKLNPQKGITMSHVLFRVGHFAGRRPWRVVAVWLLVAVAALMLRGSVGGQPDETFTLPGSESQRAADAIDERFPQQSLYVSDVIFHSDKGVESPQAMAAIDAAVAQLAYGSHVVAVGDPFDPKDSTVSSDGTTAFAAIAYDTQEVSAADFDAAEQATAQARAAGIEVEYDNGLGYAKGDSEPGSELIGIVAAVLILTLAFGSIIAVGLPIFTALGALLVGTSAIGIASGVLSMPSIATIVATMMGLGVGIDYALFIVSRHRHNIAEGMPVPVAVGRANATAGLSVLFAGLTVIVAIAGLQVSGIPMMTAMGWATAIMVAVTMVAAITLLPALLGIAGKRVNSLRIPFLGRKDANDHDTASARWAARVVSRPVRYGVVSASVLALLALPVFSMRLGFADAGNDAPSMTTRKAYDLIADAYGPGTNGPLEVVIETGGAKDPQAAAVTVHDALEHERGVASVGEPSFNEGRDLAVIEVTPTTGPQDQATSDLLARLRADVIPNAVDGTGATAMVTGNTALTDDVSAQLGDRMPLFLGAVIGLSFVVLMIVFRSVLVPLKAAALNILSVGAAYGVIVAVFQWGWAASLIGVHSTVPIMPLAPMLMFAILFGLSMDYEVFLVSRIRENYLRYRDPKRAVVDGIGSTGRVITSAALIMIAVFGAFILSNDVTTKMFGVGLSVAVLLDVTLVRMVLLPAAMTMLGHRAWWLPAWLDRRLPNVDLEGAEHEGDEFLPAQEQRELILV
jgi:RND superfamily putative drug exporter